MSVIAQFREKEAFRPDRFNPVVLAETDQSKVLFVFLEPGQFIPLHRPQVDVTLVVLEGEGTVIAGKSEGSVGPGSVAFIEAGQERGLKAITRLAAVHVVTPPPTKEDHAEVMARLNVGAWR